MKNKIAGVIAVVWGLGILLQRAQGAPGSAYNSGQMAAKLMGIVLLVAGVVTLYRAFKNKSVSPNNQP